MLSREGLLKVMDFGVARRAGETQLTTEGHLSGTPSTMAPETIAGEKPGPPADLFALGCVLYEALTGRLPFTANDALAVLYRITHDDPQSLRSMRPEIPEELAGLVHGLLEKDPARRAGPASRVARLLSGKASSRSLGRDGEAARFDMSADPTVERQSATVSSRSGRGDDTVTVDTATVTPGVENAPPEPNLAGAAEIAIAKKPREHRILRLVVAVVLAVLAVTVLVLWSGGRDRAKEERRAHAIRLSERGRALHEAGDLQRARVVFLEAAETDSDFADAWVNLGNLSRLSGDLRRAEDELRRALDINPMLQEAHLHLALVLHDAKRLDEAEREYRHVMKEDSIPVQAFNNYANLLIEQDRPTQADSLLDVALRIWHDTPVLWKNRGLAFLKKGDYDEAESAFERALELGAPNAQALLGLIAIAEARADAEALAARVRQATSSVSTSELESARAALQRLGIKLQGGAF
jgi:Tfp pilus assembly protein PilF